MWKNCKSDIQGLYHYRRYLSKKFIPGCGQITAGVPDDIMRLVLTRSEILSALETCDIILAAPVDYYEVMTVGEMFRRYVNWKDTRELWRAIEEKYPEYLPSLEYAYSQDHYYGCNMFIARRDFVDGYCTWLFDVLGEVERRISVEGDDSQHKRIYGYFSEALLNVYVLRHNMKIKCFTRIFAIFQSRSQRLKESVKNMLKKIPFLQKTVRAFRKKFMGAMYEDTRENAETEKFYVAVIHYVKYGRYIAEFTPKNPDCFIHDLESVLPEFESRAKSEGMVFTPRVILSSETPESVKRSMFELGVRVIHR